MKKSFAILLLALSPLGFAQNIADYEYIYVPKTFEKDKEMNKFGLNKILVDQLKAKKYKVIQEAPHDWPAALKDNPCAVLSANLLDDSSFFKNKVKVNFTDCQKKIILESKGSADEKEFEIGFPKALKQATQSIAFSTPKSIIELDSKKETTATTAQTIVENVSSAPISSAKEEALVFTNKNENYQLINLATGNFILVSSKSSTPFAKLFESSKPGIFHVTLGNNTKTLGYTENGNIVIEIPKLDGSYSKEIFNKK